MYSSPRDSRLWLARSLFHLEKYDDASSHLHFVFAYNELDTLEMTRAIMWLGLTFERQENYDYAREQLERVHSILVGQFGPRHLETLASQYYLAHFFYKRKSFLRALGHFKELLQVEERTRGPEKSKAIKTRCMVAVCLGQLGSLREAEPHLQQVVPRIELDPDLKSDELEDAGLLYLCLELSLCKFAECQMGIAEIMILQGHFSQAECTIRQILPTLETTGQGHSRTRHYALAEALFKQNNLVEAQQTLEKLLPEKKAPIPDGYTEHDLAGWLPRMQQLLGKIHRKLGQLNGARHCFQ
ncbi:hypothetical protein F5Y10DRAFT_292077 [Nemania abortiva]|nr:hypothetical protein F5Y10DRAFT_292077 [Nemania abortiva]